MSKRTHITVVFFKLLYQVRRDVILKFAWLLFFENLETAYRVKLITTHFQRCTEKVVMWIYLSVIFLFYSTC